MSSSICMFDDKHVPLYRVLWIADTPHFCGAEDCNCEGMYEVRLEQGESLFGSREDRDRLLAALDTWQAGYDDPDSSFEGEE